MTGRFVAESRGPGARRAGTGAFVYAVSSLAAAIVLGMLVQGLQVTGRDPGLAGIGVDVGAVSFVVALVVGLIQRLAGTGKKPVPGRWIVASACAVPAVVVGFAVILLMKSPS